MAAASKVTSSITVPDNARVLTEPQVAFLAQLSVKTLQRWAAKGLIPGRLDLPGRTVRYDRAAIEAWLARK